MNALAFAMQLLETLPGLIAAGQNVVALVTSTTDALKAMQAQGRDPSSQEWQALNDQIDALRKKLHSLE